MAINLDKTASEVKYYYSDKGATLGPFSLTQLIELIDGDTLVYKEGIEWTNAKNVDEIKRLLPEKKLVVKKSNAANSSANPNQSQIKTDVQLNQEQRTIFPVKKKSQNKTILISLILIIAIAFAAIYLLNKSKVDHFRKIEGEEQVFVNNLILRQYPDSKSTAIETFPTGTRVIIDNLEPLKLDDKHREWHKVRVIHPLYGWDKPDENFPYPFEGWMVTKECGTAWLGDSLSNVNLSRIFKNEDAGRIINSNYRHALLDYFQTMNYYDEWIIYGSNKKEELQLVRLNNFGNSAKDCNNSDQTDLIVILQNSKSRAKKLLIISLNESNSYEIVCDQVCNESARGMRKLSAVETRKFKRENNPELINPILINSDYENIVIGIVNGAVFSYQWYD